MRTAAAGHTAHVAHASHEGGAERLDRLYRRHRAEILRFVIREGASESDAEDVVQNAFLDAYQSLLGGNEPLQPRPWLFAIARNARRRSFRTPRVAAEPLAAELEAAPDEPLAVRDLVEAIERLPQNQRSVLLLREVAGHSYETIAAELELTVPSVQMLLFRARRSLRNELEAGRGGLWTLLPLPLQHGLARLGDAATTFRLAPGAPVAGLLGAAVVGASVAAGTPAEATPGPGASPHAAARPAAYAPAVRAPAQSRPRVRVRAHAPAQPREPVPAVSVVTAAPVVVEHAAPAAPVAPAAEAPPAAPAAHPEPTQPSAQAPRPAGQPAETAQPASEEPASSSVPALSLDAPALPAQPSSLPMDVAVATVTAPVPLPDAPSVATVPDVTAGLR